MVHRKLSQPIDQYEYLHTGFRWSVPETMNIADLCAHRWAKNKRSIAIKDAYIKSTQGTPNESLDSADLSYADLSKRIKQVAAYLASRGIQKGDVVACIIPQRAEMAISLLACVHIGAIGMPLTHLFAQDALEYRLQHSAAKAAIVDASIWDTFVSVRRRCEYLHTVVLIDGYKPEHLNITADWSHLVRMDAPEIGLCHTSANDPAFLIYTSGTTGPAKGAVIPHSALIGNLPGFVASQNWFPQNHDVFWSPADWAWTGGLMDALLPTLYFGKPIIAWRGRFSAETAFRIMQDYKVTNTFLFPTALKLMMKHCAQPRKDYKLKLRAIMSAGEAVGDTVFEWCSQALKVAPNEMFGQTEVNYIVGNSIQRWPARPGSMGKPYPGHRVAVIDQDGNELEIGVVGEVAIHRFDIHGDADPIFFLGYWKNPLATNEKYTGDWCRTGDLAYRDKDGYLWYQGRADDMFKAAGYRIGPSEVENCLLKHPAVANAAVVPKPDQDRGNIVKAYVVLSHGFIGNEGLIAELQAHVKGKLAPYEYPKEIEFIATLPMTTTGKVQRSVLRLREMERASS